MSSQEQELGEAGLSYHKHAPGPFVVAAEATRMPMAFTHGGPDHGIVFANDSFLKLIGYRRKEVIGHPLARLLAGERNSNTCDLINGLFSNTLEPLDVECRRKNGGRVKAELRVTPVYDQKGAISQYFLSLVDLTAQAKRQRSEKKALYRLYQQTPDFIAITEGPTHRFTFANAAYQKFVGEREIIGLTLGEAFPEPAMQELLACCDQVYRTGKAFVGTSMAVKLQRQAGADIELRYLDFIYQPIKTPDGTVTGIFCEGHDVTEQRALDDRVKELQIDLVHLTRLSAMGTMAAILAHEMTQPLTAIASYAAVCSHLNLKDGDNRAEIEHALTAIATAASRGGDIIHQLQNLTERRKTPRDHFRLKDAIRESVALVQATGYSNATIFDRSSEAIEIDADRTQIQQVLTNLLRNGCEALGLLPGRVTISTATREDTVVVSINDTGEGVSPEASKTLFRWTDSTKPLGTGIGLSICRTIIESHGGNLWLAKSGHTGSSFAFSLPLPFHGDGAASFSQSQ